ncbi:MAG TPA: RICIN domain-containing protein, partial [Verrucomicrobiae bacterium]
DQAFDGNPGSKWFGSSAPTGWIQYDFGAGNEQVVKRYTITSANDVPRRDPSSWNFLGSQDGVTWDTLDSQSSQIFANRWQQNTYDIGNTTAYRFYQLQITANNGDATGVQLSELGLWSDTGRTIPDGRYQLVNRRSNKVMDVSGGSTASGAQIVQWSYNGADSQKWDIAWQGNGQYSATGVASGDVVDVNGGSTAAGAKLIIWPYWGGNNQLWNVVPYSDGFFHFISAKSGLVADVSGGSTAGGANLIQWPDNGGSNQQWIPSLSQ